MFCPSCGVFIGYAGDPYCVLCGAKLPSAPGAVEPEVIFNPYIGNTSMYDEPIIIDRFTDIFAPVTLTVGKDRWNKAVAMIIVVVMCMGIFLVESATDEDGYQPYASEALYLGDGTLETYSLANGMISVSMDEDQRILMDFMGESADDCEWQIVNNDASKYQESGATVTKRTYENAGYGKTLELPEGSVGSYTVRAIVDGEVYEGTLVVNVPITKVYTWDFVGPDARAKRFSASINFSYSEYYDYVVDTSIGRANYHKIADFAVVDDSIRGLEESLRSAYVSVYPMDAEWYANFILSFVQINMDYPPLARNDGDSMSSPDTYLYGKAEYFAYPLQTLFFDLGDCEDTAILCAALFDAAGFDAAVAVLYADSSSGGLTGHAAAGVKMTKVVSSTPVPSEYIVSDKVVGGVNYYACETTANTQIAAGYLDEDYDKYLQNPDKRTALSAFYPVKING